ncbi:MAG: TatD family deoxyribonuclease [Gammaproteobacteria bacterium 28-57-27]|nr:MAG: TatD family deoxyribonuclease [Gammaproteobacteria bacterium 28-57-27]
MQLVDTHCHLDRIDLAPWGGDFSAFMQAARSADLAWMLCVAIDLESYPAMCALVAPYPEIALSVGVHPNEEPELSPTAEKLFEQLLELGRDARVVAIGETGLDYFRTEAGAAWQVERFRTHIEAARQLQKPLIIHSREAREDTLRVLEDAGARDCGGVMHCFVEDWATAKRALDLGFYISFSGVLTYKSAAELREVAKQIPADRLLIETDSPYLAPVPQRGKPNIPLYVRHVAEQLAALRGWTLEETAARTLDNARRLFKF